MHAHMIYAKQARKNTRGAVGLEVIDVTAALDDWVVVSSVSLPAFLTDAMPSLVLELARL